MTRKEAIKQLQAFSTCMIVDDAEPYVVEALNMAVEALEQEPCEDAISRQAAIDAIWDGVNMDIYTREVKECLEELPSVNPRPETGWIPVKWHTITDEEREREGYPKEWVNHVDCIMPEDEEKILITVKGHNGQRWVEKDICYIDDGFYLDSGYDWVEDVEAWMPLPKPYEPQESEESE